MHAPASCSIRSSRPRSAQWISSNTKTVACSAATASMKQRTEKNSASRSSAACSGSSRGGFRGVRRPPRDRARRDARSRPSFAGTTSRLVVLENAGELLHLRGERAVGAALAVGRHRPRTMRPPPAVTIRRNSDASRDLPMPGGPSTVTTWGVHRGRPRPDLEQVLQSRSRGRRARARTAARSARLGEPRAVGREAASTSFGRGGSARHSDQPVACMRMSRAPPGPVRRRVLLAGARPC